MSENAEPVGGVGALSGMSPAGTVGYFRQTSRTPGREQDSYGQFATAQEKAAAQQGEDASAQAGDSVQLSPEAEQQLKELKQRDAEVRAHERAHMAAAGQHAMGGAQYTYQAGPDGRRYAIGGHVNIDTSEVPDDPEASEEKAQQVRRAALAPGDPSAQDMQVAAQAAQMEAEARVDAREEKQEEAQGGAADGGMQANVDPLTSSLAAGPNVNMAAQGSGVAASAGSRQDEALGSIETERSSRRQAVQAYESASLGFPSAGELSRGASSGDGGSWRMTADGLFAAYSSSGSQPQRPQAAGGESVWSGVSPQRAARTYSGMAGGTGYSASASVSGAMFSFAV